MRQVALSFCIFLIIIGLIIGLLGITIHLFNDSHAVYNVNTANCRKTINLPPGERIVSATGREIITTTSDSPAKTYYLRSYYSNYCITIKER